MLTKHTKIKGKGALFAKYMGFYLYVKQATEAIPKNWKGRHFRHWKKQQKYFKKQYENISSINYLFNKKPFDLNQDDISKIKKVCEKVRLTIQNREKWQ